MLNNLYAELRNLPKFRLQSADIEDGVKLSMPQLHADLGGQDLSPQLSWRDFPPTTKSFAVTVYDPDAPRPGGFWHWAVINIPANVTELSAGADQELPASATSLNNDHGQPAFMGAAPPVGTGKHRYFFVVYALDVDKLEVIPETTPAQVTEIIKPHALAWASLVPWYEQA